MPRSPIHDLHERAGARFVDFGGWDMPVQYTGVLDEHRAVRNGVGVFDVSHLGRFSVAGRGATELVRRELCNDITRVAPGRAQYTMALNDDGGVDDDIIVWYLGPDRFWVMPNGTNSDDIVDRFVGSAPPGVVVEDIRPSTALFAVQGPTSASVLEAIAGTMPGRFRVTDATIDGIAVTMAGTGYTGERGAEIAVPVANAASVWNAIVEAGATPCGLGARDTLRLEMGYPLWGQDLDATTTPLEAGLGWVVAWDHEFVGRDALDRSRSTPSRRLVAFTTEGRAIPRTGYLVTTPTGGGVVTSGNFSPTLGHGIGLAYVDGPLGDDSPMTVTIRGAEVPATIVALPFIER
jgi:aminomethyltransferase